MKQYIIFILIVLFGFFSCYSQVNLSKSLEKLSEGDLLLHDIGNGVIINKSFVKKLTIIRNQVTPILNKNISFSKIKLKAFTYQPLDSWGNPASVFGHGKMMRFKLNLLISNELSSCNEELLAEVFQELRKNEAFELIEYKPYETYNLTRKESETEKPFIFSKKKYGEFCVFFLNKRIYIIEIKKQKFKGGGTPFLYSKLSYGLVENFVSGFVYQYILFYDQNNIIGYF